MTFKVQAFSNVFSYSCAAVDKISTDIARRAVPLRQLSFLFWDPGALPATKPTVVKETQAATAASIHRPHANFIYHRTLALFMRSGYLAVAFQD